MPSYIKIGDKYFTGSEQGSFLENISERDIVGRRGTGGSLDVVRREGDLIDVDPSQITLRPKWMLYTEPGAKDYEGTLADWRAQGMPYQVMAGNKSLGFVKNQAQAQALGITAPQLTPGGEVGTNQVYSQYLQQQGPQSTPRTFADQQAALNAQVPIGTPGYDLINGTKTVLDTMNSKGYVLNPNANLDDPNTIAEFLRIAESETEPYYRSGLKVARDQFLRQQGYTTDDILRTETELEKKYGTQVRDLAASSAESGFAQSGKRVEGERNLALDTQSQIDENRRKLGFEAYGKAGIYAEKYGGLLGEKIPGTPQLANAPRVLQGEGGFARPGGTSAFYSLSDDVYSNLVGSQEKERVTGNRALAQDREELYRTNQTQTRNLI